MLGTLRAREAEYIDIRIALPHDGNDGLFFATCHCGRECYSEMVNAWEGPQLEPVSINTSDDIRDAIWRDEMEKSKAYRDESDIPEQQPYADTSWMEDDKGDDRNWGPGEKPWDAM